MTIREIANLSPSDYFYNLRDKTTNYVSESSFKMFDVSDEERNKIQTREEFLDYQKNRKKVLEDITANVPYDKKVPLNAQVTGRTDTEDLIIENIIFTSREKAYVTCTLYLPKVRDEKIPAIVMQMGHAANGRLYPSYQRIARLHAMAGFAVLAIDPIGQGERISYIDEKTGEILVGATCPEHQYFGNQCFLTGNYPIRYFLCDAMRAIDYLETREEIDGEKIGATGTSGGGTMTAMLMAYDDRVKAASPSCFLTSRREYYYAGGTQDSEQIWVAGTKNCFDHYELISCFCPKPLLILAANSDFFPLEGTEKIYKKGREFYKLMGCEDNLRMFVDECEHKYTLNAAAKSAEFFSEVFLNKKVSIQNSDYGILNDEELWSTKTGQVVKEFPDAKTIFHENLKNYIEASVKTKEEKQYFFTEKVYNNRKETEFYLKKFETPDTGDLSVERYMWYTQPNMPCYGVKFTSKINIGRQIPIKICLFENGTDDIEKYERNIRNICEEGYVAFVVDLSATGKCEPYDLNAGRETRGNLGVIERLSKDLFFLDDSLCALKTYDLLQTIRLIREEFHQSEITVYGVGKACVFVRIAEILEEEIKTEFQDEISIHDIVTNKYYDNYNISSIIMPKLALYLKNEA